MPMDQTEVTAMKSLIDASRKKTLNFGFCLASKPENSVLYMDRLKSADVLAKRAKKAAGGNKLAFGTLETSGKVITFNLVEKAPAGMELGAKQFLKSHDLKFQVAVVEGSEETSGGPQDTGDKKTWEQVRDLLSKRLDGSLSKLKNTTKMRAVWDLANQKAEDGDYAGACEAADVVEAEIRQATKVYGQGLLEQVVKGFDAKKAAMSDDDRKKIRVLIGQLADGVANESADTLFGLARKTLKTISDVIADLKDQKDGKGSPLAAEIKRLEGDLKTLRESLEDPNTGGLKRNLQNMHDQYKEAKRRKPNDTKRDEKYQTAVERTETLIKEKEDAAAEHNAEILKQIAALEKVKTASEDQQRRFIDAVDKRLATIRKLDRSEDITKAQAAIEATIKEMGEAVEWQAEQVKRAEGGENAHGTGRHGAQTGVERQARRAATGGTAADSDHNEAGVTQHIKEWRGTRVTWEVDGSTGERKVKSRTEIRKQVVADVARHFNSDKGSAFNTPVLEKQAVDMAVNLMEAKGWNEISTSTTNPKNWRDLLDVAVVVEAPQTRDIDGKTYTKSWGYQVSRKEAATMALGDADQVLKKFEKGEITEDKMLEDLGVEKLLDGKALKKIPYATVVLHRDAKNGKWKSKTQYPNADKTAAGWNIEGASVRKTGGAEEVATF